MSANMSAICWPSKHMSVILTPILTCHYPTIPAKAAATETAMETATVVAMAMATATAAAIETAMVKSRAKGTRLHSIVAAMDNV